MVRGLAWARARCQSAVYQYADCRPAGRLHARRTVAGLAEVSTYEALSRIPPERMVTFSIIAHIDHGKSSLSQILLERAGNVKKGEEGSQDALDTLDVERERGITVKAVTASMARKASGRVLHTSNLELSGERERDCLCGSRVCAHHLWSVRASR